MSVCILKDDGIPSTISAIIRLFQTQKTQEVISFELEMTNV